MAHRTVLLPSASKWDLDGDDLNRHEVSKLQEETSEKEDAINAKRLEEQRIAADAKPSHSNTQEGDKMKRHKRDKKESKSARHKKSDKHEHRREHRHVKEEKIAKRSRSPTDRKRPPASSTKTRSSDTKDSEISSTAPSPKKVKHQRDDDDHHRRHSTSDHHRHTSPNRRRPDNHRGRPNASHTYNRHQFQRDRGDHRHRGRHDRRMSAGSAEASGSQPVYLTQKVVQHAQEIQKRKLLWQRGKEDVKDKAPTVWNTAVVPINTDDKSTEKFQKLLGLKPTSTPADSGTTAVVEQQQLKQQSLFNDLDRQYHMARLATHTQRGLGLGFNS